MWEIIVSLFLIQRSSLTWIGPDDEGSYSASIDIYWTLVVRQIHSQFLILLPIQRSSPGMDRTDPIFHYHDMILNSPTYWIMVPFIPTYSVANLSDNNMILWYKFCTNDTHPIIYPHNHFVGHILPHHAFNIWNCCTVFVLVEIAARQFRRYEPKLVLRL